MGTTLAGTFKEELSSWGHFGNDTLGDVWEQSLGFRVILGASFRELFFGAVFPTFRTQPLDDNEILQYGQLEQKLHLNVSLCGIAGEGEEEQGSWGIY